MDVTPTPAMYQVMERVVNAWCGEEPAKIETSPAANRRRENRQQAMTILHNFVALTMRVGVARYLEEHGVPTAQATAIETAVGDKLPTH